MNCWSTEQLWELFLISLTVTYSRTVIAICWKQIGACPFQVQQAWHAHTVSIWMIQHNSGMSLAALSLMAALQLFVYSWWVSLNRNQKTHPVICQLPLSFLIVTIRTRAGKRRLLIVHKHFLYVSTRQERRIPCLGIHLRPRGRKFD